MVRGSDNASLRKLSSQLQRERDRDRKSKLAEVPFKRGITLSGRTEIALLFRYERIEELYRSSLDLHISPRPSSGQSSMLLTQCFYGFLFLQQISCLENKVEGEAFEFIKTVSKAFSGKDTFQRRPTRQEPDQD